LRIYKSSFKVSLYAHFKCSLIKQVYKVAVFCEAYDPNIYIKLAS